MRRLSVFISCVAALVPVAARARAPEPGRFERISAWEASINEIFVEACYDRAEIDTLTYLKGLKERNLPLEYVIPQSDGVLRKVTDIEFVTWRYKTCMVATWFQLKLQTSPE